MNKKTKKVGLGVGIHDGRGISLNIAKWPIRICLVSLMQLRLPIHLTKIMHDVIYLLCEASYLNLAPTALGICNLSIAHLLNAY